MVVQCSHSFHGLPTVWYPICAGAVHRRCDNSSMLPYIKHFFAVLVLFRYTETLRVEESCVLRWPFRRVLLHLHKISSYLSMQIMCNTHQYPKATNICSGHLFTVSLSYKQQGIYRKIRKDKKLYLAEISLRCIIGHCSKTKNYNEYFLIDFPGCIVEFKVLQA